MNKMCEVCGRRPGSAKVIIKGNVSKTVYVCRECEERQLSSSRIQSPRPAPTAKAPAPPDLTCGHCGWTTGDFIATQKLGCAQCYSELFPAVQTYVRRCQPSEYHVGKSPAYTHAARGGEYEYLRKQLDCAVKEERFADAAKFKNLLDGLKEGR